MKIELCIKVNNGSLTFFPCQTIPVVIRGEYRMHKVKVSEPIQYPYTADHNFTDYFTAVALELAPKMTYTALRTVYASSCNPMMLNLMTQCIQYSSGSQITHEQFEQFLSDCDNITGYINADLSDSEVVRQIAYANEQVKSIAKVHTYEMRTGADGKRHKVEVIPYVTFEQTEYGKAVDKEEQVNSDMEVNDLIQTALNAICELCYFGLVSTPADVWSFSSYVYKAVNKHIESMKSRRGHLDSLYTYDDKGNESVITIKSADKKIERLERDSVLDSLEALIVENIDKRMDVEKVLITYNEIYRNGESEQYVANLLGCKQQQVSRYKKAIKQALNTPVVKQALAEIIYK